MPHETSRRELLRLSATAAFGLTGISRLKAQSPNDRVRFAIVGCGGKGRSGMDGAARYGDIVALCDIDSNTLAQAKDSYGYAKTYSDFRKMIEERHDKFDAVVVSTPDHTHAVAAAMAMRYGKAVYCEKPLARTIWEARRIGEIAKEMKVATQMGNQGTANNSMRKTAALIKKGAFGAVKEVHCWTDRPGGWWPQGVNRPASKPVPANVDWDLWLGPSPWRDYADGYHSFAWRGWWDFGTGAMGDIACHCMNLPYMALDLRDPVAVQAETPGHNRDSYPAWSIIKYEFAANKNRGPVTLTWYDGGKKPPQELAPTFPFGGNGSLIVCEKANIFSPGEYAGDSKWDAQIDLPEVEFVESPGHMAEWVDAIKGGRPAVSNFANYSSPLTEMALVGNLAVWANGPRLEWDSRAMRVKGTREYDSLIRPKYRKGYSL
jgi:predicted dehydrogenase